MIKEGLRTQDRFAIAYEPPPPMSEQKTRRRKYLRHVQRRYSLEEKEDILRKYFQLTDSGTMERIALERLGLTYDLIFQWREEISAQRKHRELAAVFEKNNLIRNKPAVVFSPESCNAEKTRSLLNTAIVTMHSDDELSITYCDGRRLDGLTMDQAIRFLENAGG